MQLVSIESGCDDFQNNIHENNKCFIENINMMIDIEEHNGNEAFHTGKSKEGYLVLKHQQRAPMKKQVTVIMILLKRKTQ